MFQGKAAVEDVIQTDSATGASFIAGRHEVHNPNDLFGGRDLKIFLSRAATRYDLIVLTALQIQGLAPKQPLELAQALFEAGA